MGCKSDNDCCGAVPLCDEGTFFDLTEELLLMEQQAFRVINGEGGMGS